MTCDNAARYLLSLSRGRAGLGVSRDWAYHFCGCRRRWVVLTVEKGECDEASHSMVAAAARVGKGEIEAESNSQRWRVITLAYRRWGRTVAMGEFIGVKGFLPFGDMSMWRSFG